MHLYRRPCGQQRLHQQIFTRGARSAALGALLEYDRYRCRLSRRQGQVASWGVTLERWQAGTHTEYSGLFAGLGPCRVGGCICPHALCSQTIVRTFWHGTSVWEAIAGPVTLAQWRGEVHAANVSATAEPFRAHSQTETSFFKERNKVTAGRYTRHHRAASAGNLARNLGSRRQHRADRPRGEIGRVQ